MSLCYYVYRILLRLPHPLPVPAPVHAWLARHRQPHDRLRLPPVVHAAVIFPPSCLLGIPDQIGASDMVMVADLTMLMA